MDALPRIALTGATGFVGQALLPVLLAEGYPVRALIRARKNRAAPLQAGLEWISGDLAGQQALAELTSGADTVIHLAGITKANDPSEFDRVNAQQTAALAGIAQAAGVKHFIHVSSLTATRPAVSAYARSKAESERLARERAGAMALTIVRAPAILGPGDEATRQVFSLLAAGYLPAPGGRQAGFRFSVMDVLDLARFLTSLVRAPVAGQRVVTPASQLSVSWTDIAAAATRATGRPVRMLPVPAGLMHGAGHLSDLMGRLSGRPQVFSSAKVRELFSGDWIAETQIEDPAQLHETLGRCLAPFLASGRQSQGSERKTNGSET